MAASIAVMVAALVFGTALGDDRRSALAAPAPATAVPSADAIAQVGEPSPTPPGVTTPEMIKGVLTRSAAISKASLPAGNTIIRVEAKLVLRSDLERAGHGIAAVGKADWVWVVAQWGQFAADGWGTSLGAAKTQQQPAQPDAWRYLLVDARTGEAYAGGGGRVEAGWWSGLTDRFSDSFIASR